jgi:hypothetical protein
MSRGEDSPPEHATAERDRRRHELISPLTTILGRAQLLARMVRRSPSLAESERRAMLDGLVIVEAAVLELVGRIDALDRAGPDGRVRDEARGGPECGCRDGGR